jgi:hypothetical protein
MAKKNDMDHMRSILAHAASRATPARMPTPNVDNMVKRPSTGPFSGKGTPARMPTPNVDNMVKRPSTGPFSGKATPARMPSMTKKVK